jgi:hypothetical protein
MTPDMMWMELFTGPHISTDAAVVKGKVEWLRHAEGIPWHDGMFQHWIIHTQDDGPLTRRLVQWIARELPRYTGMINIETIGGRIIEAQIRFADQWCDLYGRDWFNAVVTLYGEGRWPLLHHGHARRLLGSPLRPPRQRAAAPHGGTASKNPRPAPRLKPADHLS